MRIALTHNLRLSDSEEEAEFDTEETVNALAAAIERLGHRVEKMEVSGPASRTVARLEAFSPDLIFNTAEGRRGRFREAFFPALFEELGFPYTGSDAYALAVTLDKQLTKLILREQGVRTPGWQFVEKVSELKPDDLHFPVIVKPNYEGSSKGITQDSVAESVDELQAQGGAGAREVPRGRAGRGIHRRPRSHRALPRVGRQRLRRRALSGGVRGRRGPGEGSPVCDLRLRAEDPARRGDRARAGRHHRGDERAAAQDGARR